MVGVAHFFSTNIRPSLIIRWYAMHMSMFSRCVYSIRRVRPISVVFVINGLTYYVVIHKSTHIFNELLRIQPLQLTIVEWVRNMLNDSNCFQISKITTLTWFNRFNNLKWNEFGYDQLTNVQKSQEQSQFYVASEIQCPLLFEQQVVWSNGSQSHWRFVFSWRVCKSTTIILLSIGIGNDVDLEAHGAVFVFASTTGWRIYFAMGDVIYGFRPIDCGSIFFGICIAVWSVRTWGETVTWTMRHYRDWHSYLQFAIRQNMDWFVQLREAWTTSKNITRPIAKGNRFQQLPFDNLGEFVLITCCKFFCFDFSWTCRFVYIL